MKRVLFLWPSNTISIALFEKHLTTWTNHPGRVVQKEKRTDSSFFKTYPLLKHFSIFEPRSAGEMAELAGAEVTAGAEALVVKELRKEDADDTENGEKNVQEVLAGKIAQLDAKKNEDKSTEKELSRMYKKASKELKEQLDAITSDSEKVKFLQQKFLDKMHQCNSADRKVENMQVRRWCRGAGSPRSPRAGPRPSPRTRTAPGGGSRGCWHTRATARVPPRPVGGVVHCLRIP
jgi:hypothetical protein